MQSGTESLEVWKLYIGFSSAGTLKKDSICLEVCGNFFFPLKILPVPSSKLVILALVFSSPVLGLLADSSDKMPNDQGK